MKNSTSATIASANRTGWMIAPPAMAMISRMIARSRSIDVSFVQVVDGYDSSGQGLCRLLGPAAGLAHVQALLLELSGDTGELLGDPLKALVASGHGNAEYVLLPA